MKFRQIFFVFSLLILCTVVSVGLAKTPNTAKIVFVSIRDGNREIYIMNPDGTEKVRLTQNFSDMEVVRSRNESTDKDYR